MHSGKGTVPEFWPGYLKKVSHLSSASTMLAPIVNAASNNSDLKKKKRTLLGLLIIVSFLSYTIYFSIILKWLQHLTLYRRTLSSGLNWS